MKTSPASWDDLRFLLAVHRDKSFFAAGKSLGVAASTVARRVGAVERSLGRVLVRRSNDGTELDEDGLRLVALAEQLELGLASLVRDGRDAEVSGTVRVSLSEGFVRPLVLLLARVQAKHPELRVEVISESRIADLARGEADIGIRIVRSASAPIVSKLLGRAATGVFASREYVQRRLPGGRLSRDVAGRHDWVGLDASLERLPQEQWMRAYGAGRFTFRSNSLIAIEQAVVAGMGLGVLGEVQATSLTGLVKLHLETTPPPVEVFLAFRRDAPSRACRFGTKRCSTIGRLTPYWVRTSCARRAPRITSRGGWARGSPAVTSASASLRTPERSWRTRRRWLARSTRCWSDPPSG